MAGASKWFLRGLIIFSTVVVALVNFPFVWGLLASAIIEVILSYSKRGSGEEHAGKGDFPGFSLFVMMASLLFFISGQFIGGYIPNKLGLVNVDISPTLGATTKIAKSVLAEDPFFGLGPNKFGDAYSS